jgi:glycerate kinase
VTDRPVADRPVADRPLRVLFAPDSYKGTFTSIQVARALAAGWSAARPLDEVLLAPLADGGEGTLEAIAAAGGWSWRTAAVDDPLGRPITARWLRSDDGGRAVLEMAEASGLSRIARDERDPAAATSIGTGQLILAAARDGVRHVTLGIGGSATTDGGRGLLRGLGGRVPGGRDGAAPDLATLDPALAGLALDVACDVSNPLLGPDGAAAVFGPQKGATPDLVAELDARNATWADHLERATGRDVRHVPGAGAAGGVGFALLAIQDRFASFALWPGVQLAMEAAGFDAKLAAADLVVTGEGRIDASTAFGKTALAVARRAHEAGLTCIAVGGGVLPEGIEALRPFGAIAVPVVERLMTLEEAIAAGTAPLERAGSRIASLVTAGITVGATSGAGGTDR